MINEPQKENDLFYTCSLLEFISRKTKNSKKAIVEKIGIDKIKKIYDIADVLHSENIEKIADEIIQERGITQGDYDIITNCRERIPSYYELGRIYTTLILNVDRNSKNHVDTLVQVLTSWIIEKIDNYESNMYYETPDYIYACYKEGKIL